MLRILFASIMILTACQSASEVSSKPVIVSTDTETLPFNRVEVSDPPTPAQREACKAEGGSIRPVGLLGRQFCVQPYPDAGKVCTSREDCHGECVEGPETPRPPFATGQRIEGVCNADTNWQGCHVFVEKGEVLPICAD